MRALLLGAALWMAAVPAQGQEWHVRQMARITVADGSEVRSIALHDSMVYVLDTGLGRMAVYSATGEMVRVLGKLGNTRGAFSEHASHVLIVGDRPALVDAALQRLTVYDRDGSVAHQRELGIHHATASAWTATGENIFFLTPPIPSGYGFEEETPDHVLWAINPTSSAPPREIARFALPPSMTVTATGSVNVNLAAPVLLVAGSRAGRLLHARSDRYEVAMLDADGTHLRSISRSVPETLYTAARQAEIRSRADSVNQRAFAAGRAMSGSAGEAIPIDYDLPTVAPKVTSLIAAGSLTLVGRSEALDGPTTLDVFDGNGEFTGSVELAAGFRPLAAAERQVWGIQTDASGKKHIVALELYRNE